MPLGKEIGRHSRPRSESRAGSSGSPAVVGARFIAPWIPRFHGNDAQSAKPCAYAVVEAGFALATILLSIVFAPSSAAQVKSKPPPAGPSAPRPAANETSRLNAEVIRTATEYRDKLVNQMKLEDLEVYRREREVKSRTEMLEKGFIAPAELEQSKLALAKAQAKIADTAQRIRDAEMIIGEAEGRAQLATLPPLPAGGYSESGMLIRYNGGAPWSLADSEKIETFFAARFGKPLPVSARGETELHRQMKFDHRNALDVALHPDSAEGRALMDYLRKGGIPFVAFRGRMAGSSTGAHIHIGMPSLRVARP